jgi:hypothetical protein
MITNNRQRSSELPFLKQQKNTSTLAERIGVKGVEARTFHKLGKDIVVACETRQIRI